MRTKLLGYLSAILLLSITSCDESTDTSEYGNWVKQSDFEGVTRSGAISFSIGNYAYVGLGSDGDDYLTDFWRFDPSKNFWQKMASFPGVGRLSTVSFSLDGKGYLGTGYNDDLDEEELNDFWEYDPDTDTWTQKADFPGSKRYAAVGFALEGNGYIGTGYDGNYLKDFWRYDPTSDSWTQAVSLYGSKRESATAFVINGQAYIATGRNNGVYLYDFWRFDPSDESWTDLTLYDEDDTYETYLSAISRYNGVSFSVDGLGYLATGISDSYTSSVYSYDPDANEWEDDITAFEGSSRSNAVAFVVSNKAYIATGRNSSQRFDDIWSFDPLAEYDEYD